MRIQYPSLNMCLLILVSFCVALISSTIVIVDAFLYENGTCTNEKVKEKAEQVINTNGTVNDFLKSLPSDNTILAEIICQNRTAG